MTKSIVFTGGGTAGHVTPNLPLMTAFKLEGWKVSYIGSADGIEKNMIEATNTTFYPVKNGKLRRYFSLKNFIDPFKITLGIIQSYLMLRKLKPQVLFSKGGFVAFPVVVGAWLNRIPVVAHESDMTVGLANKLCLPFIDTLCVNFAVTKNHLKNQEKVIVTGTPVRAELFHGILEKGLALCNFNNEKPCLLVIGGSIGARSINYVIREALPELTKYYQVIHLCGKGKVDKGLNNIPGYCQFEYVNAELADLFACAEVVISRSGANSLYEILALAKPHILIPLSARVSRGDQIQNARYFEKLGISKVIDDEKLTVDKLTEVLSQLMREKEAIIQKIQALKISSATEAIMEILHKTGRCQHSACQVDS
jgi:UDP-N-acetylglucosamine--N-acetylmuramyl-(pentapeptide) pyrophosphoryl-undecaprenol N-acetylglucosamine transferase